MAQVKKNAALRSRHGLHLSCPTVLQESRVLERRLLISPAVGNVGVSIDAPPNKMGSSSIKLPVDRNVLIMF